jgi:hypothetical protein
MTSHNLQTSQSSLSEAMLDLIEQNLLILATASLDDDPAPAQYVDEFSTEFMIHLSMPPR